MIESFLDAIPEYVKDGKHKEESEQYGLLVKMIEPALQVLMAEDEEPVLLIKTFARQSISSDKEYAVHLFFTNRKIYSVYMKRTFTRKVQIETGIIEYPDIEIKEKGAFGLFKKPYIVGKYRKIDDKLDKRRRITGLRIPNDADATEVSRAMRFHGGTTSTASSSHSQSSVKPTGESPVNLLQELQKLHDTGILSDEEFQQKKAEILARI